MSNPSILSSGRPLRVVGVSGSLTDPSRTTTLIERIIEEVGRVLPIETHLIRLQDLGPHLGGALHRKQLAAEAEAELSRIESADLLVVGTPVYRASFTGLFKYVFDFVDQFALVDTPVLLAATGGSERHALIIEHQLRPLFGFFQSVALPVGVYAQDSEFARDDDGYQITDQPLIDRIERSIAKALPLIRSSLVELDEVERTLAGESVGSASAGSDESIE